VFSFHAVKSITTGEGGAVTTNSPALYERLKRLRSHGIEREQFSDQDLGFEDGKPNPWYYEMRELGYNYRMTDFQAALGTHQLTRLRTFVDQRNKLADEYHAWIRSLGDDHFQTLERSPNARHAYHLFVLKIPYEKIGIPRGQLMRVLKEMGIGTQVHYIPTHYHPYYQKKYGFKRGDYPASEQYYEQALSIPLYPLLDSKSLRRVTASLEKIVLGKVS
jgi:dTDP-4-amino-4,6-dideoxygalactose transaminase